MERNVGPMIASRVSILMVPVLACTALAGCGASATDPASVSCSDRQQKQASRDALDSAMVGEIRKATTRDIASDSELHSMADDAFTEACRGKAADYTPYQGVKADLERATR